MKKPNNWIRIVDSAKDCDCPFAYIVAYYLSRFDRDAYLNLGYGNITRTHEKIGSILNLSSNTIKNFRDAFDPYHENCRKGWWQRELWHFEKEIYEGFTIYTEAEMYELVMKVLTQPDLSFEKLFDSDYIASEVSIFPDEVFEDEKSATFREGSIRQIRVNAYERNSKARKTCIEHYGANCYICSFNFESLFGDIGKDFIHVHHLVPLSDVCQEYEINPILDLRPVCPNCHAMLHRRNPPFTIEEIKEIINNKSQGNIK